MGKQATNVITPDPDYLVGYKAGQQVLVPKGGDLPASFVLAQSGVPVIIPSSGTFNDTTGSLSLTTSLPFAPAGVVQVFIYSGAGIPTSQLYYATFSAANACQLWLDPSGTVKPTGITAGAYAGGTAAATLASAILQGGAMGLNGTLRITAVYSAVGAGGTKTQRFTLGGTVVDAFGAITAGAQMLHKQAHIHNRGSYSSQVSSGSTGGNSSAYTLNTGNPNYTTIDTSTSQAVGIVGAMVSAADALVLEQYLIEVLPS